jgi:hypothetical protein
MASSRCANCEGSLFEMIQNSPTKSAYKMNFIQCSKCGAVVGVVDYFNVGAMLHKQGEALKAIATKLGVPVDI